MIYVPMAQGYRIKNHAINFLKYHAEDTRIKEIAYNPAQHPKLSGCRNVRRTKD